MAAGHDVRALVRDPRGLGRHRVDVQIALGDLARLGDRHLQRQALRGVDIVIHLAAAIRDEPHARVEELNGLATARLLRAAERAEVDRFVFFSALGATEFQRTRFFRAKALSEKAVAESPLPTTIFAPSIVYDPGDRWVRLMKRLALLPAVLSAIAPKCPLCLVAYLSAFGVTFGMASVALTVVRPFAIVLASLVLALALRRAMADRASRSA